jgi:hypothetical protein
MARLMVVKGMVGGTAKMDDLDLQSRTWIDRRL